jgi:SH3-like domain-containing protein
VKWEYGTGFPLKVIQKQGDWLQVKDFEDEVGWIHKTHLDTSSHLIVKANKNKEETINIRSGPSNDTAIIGNAYHGVVFAKLEVKSDWVKVQHESGFTGWVKKTLLWGI